MKRKRRKILQKTIVMMSEIEKQLKIVSDMTEKRAKEFLNNEDGDIKYVYDAMQYSFFAGGKRIRPFLVLEFCRMFGGNMKIAQDFAVAIEMVHTYSLIHDDLPCMDNDDYRRGKLTNHKVFGDAVATLAGDALLTYAFEVIAGSGADNAQIAEAVLKLANGAGAQGMIGGQIIDMRAEKEKIGYETLLKLHSKKTGALICLSAELGCIAAGACDENREKALQYARNIGLCFQIIDDILDVTGDFETLGKKTGSDTENSKTTFLSFMSVEDATAYAEKLTNDAISAIDGLNRCENLIGLAKFLLTRKK